MEPADVVLKPVTVTHVGLLRLVQTGHLYCVDAHQWRLYAPLRTPAFQNQKTKKLGQTNKNNLLSQNQTFSHFVLFFQVLFAFLDVAQVFRASGSKLKPPKSLEIWCLQRHYWLHERVKQMMIKQDLTKKTKTLGCFWFFNILGLKSHKTKKMCFLFFHFRTKKTRENQKNNLSSQNQTSFSQKLRFCFFVLLEFFVCFWFFY